MKIYAVIHVYDVDGGYGDAIGTMDILFVSPNKELCDEYTKKWSDPHVYDTPYNDLYCGELFVEECKYFDALDLEKSPSDIDDGFFDGYK